MLLYSAIFISHIHYTENAKKLFTPMADFGNYRKITENYKFEKILKNV